MPDIINMKKLNEAQQKAVNHTDGPLMIIAGAGTGKTTVITEKYAHLVESGFAKPEEVLALTFTDKSAGEMEERVESRIESAYTTLHISTFHTFCKEVLEHYALEIGLPDRFSLLTPVDTRLLMKRNWSKFELEYYNPIGNPTKHIKALSDHFGKCKDELLSSERYIAYADGFEGDGDEKVKLTEVSRAYKVYNDLLLDNNSLDMSDLIYHTYRLFETRPNILRAIRNKFRYIFVDEFQDVNSSQYELVKLLAGDEGNITVVGDDDQSIYAFRGANVSNILRFKDDYPKCTEVVLTENYRSTQEILDTAYRSVKHNDPERLEVKLDIDKRLLATNTSDGQSVFHIHTHTDDDQVNFVVERIRELYESHEDVVWDDFGILIRSNSRAEPFMHALSRAGIPHEFLASRGLFKQKVVIDALSFFRLMVDSRDDRSMYRLLRMPHLEIPESDIHEITGSAKKFAVSYIERARQVSKSGMSTVGGETVRALLETLYTSLKSVREKTPSGLLFQFFELSGYLAHLTRRVDAGDRDMIRQAYQLNKFFTFISDFEKLSPENDIRAFMIYMKELEEVGEDGPLYQPIDTPDSVNIMTIHNSKGLEFSYVFVVDLVDQKFPSRDRSQGIDIPIELIHETLPEGDVHLAEERRLFYVAMTRAKKLLYLMSADYYEGAKRKKKISSFLIELEYSAGSEVVTDTNPLDALPVGTEMIVPDGEFVYPIPNKFSFSQIRSYDTCPYQYKLSTILKIKTGGSAASSFGKSIHKTLQAFYEQVIKLNSPEQAGLFETVKSRTTSGEIVVPTFEELLQIYDTEWLPYDYDSEDQKKKYQTEGVGMLKIFYMTNEGNWHIPASVEGWFKITIGGNLVHGRMDRVDLKEDGKLEIIDYKTGTPKKKLETDDKEQLLIYHIAAETLPEFQNIGLVGELTFYYVKDGSSLSFEAKDKDIEKLKEKIIRIIDGIKSRDFTPKPSQFSCGWCDFRNICDYRAE
jgi:DNA helicase II / ATP-dependent DNA helicase PcrA